MAFTTAVKMKVVVMATKHTTVGIHSCSPEKKKKRIDSCILSKGVVARERERQTSAIQNLNGECTWRVQSFVFYCSKEQNEN